MGRLGIVYLYIKELFFSECGPGLEINFLTHLQNLTSAPEIFLLK